MKWKFWELFCELGSIKITGSCLWCYKCVCLAKGSVPGSAKGWLILSMELGIVPFLVRLSNLRIVPSGVYVFAFFSSWVVQRLIDFFYEVWYFTFFWWRGNLSNTIVPSVVCVCAFLGTISGSVPRSATGFLWSLELEPFLMMGESFSPWNCT